MATASGRIRPAMLRAQHQPRHLDRGLRRHRHRRDRGRRRQRHFRQQLGWCVHQRVLELQHDSRKPDRHERGRHGGARKSHRRVRVGRGYDHRRDTPAARNIISGNAAGGVSVSGAGADDTVIQGNYIGTNITGTATVSNQGHGVSISNSPGHTIGGSAAGAGNLISGNTSAGVSVSGATTARHLIQGNLIGLNAAGTGALGNSNGIFVTEAAGTTIGGVAPGAGNVVSGNAARASSCRRARRTRWCRATGSEPMRAERPPSRMARASTSAHLTTTPLEA